MLLVAAPHGLDDLLHMILRRAVKYEMLALRFSGGLALAVVVGKSEAATKKQLSRTLQAFREQ